MRATDRSFLDLLHRYLGELRVPSSERIIFRFSADCGVQGVMAGGKTVRGTLRLYTGTLLTFQGRVQDEMAGRLVSQMRDRLYSDFSEFVQLRAGGVTLDGGALILPSLPEPRLATLVGLLVRSGAGYLGDEIVRLEPVLRQVHRMPLPLLIPSEDLPLFPELGREPSRKSRLPTGSPRRPVPIAELGGAAGEPSEVRWVVFPEFEPDGPTRLEPMGESEALFRYMQTVLNMHIWSDRALFLGREMLSGAPVARLKVGSLPEAAKLLIRSPLGVAG